LTTGVANAQLARNETAGYGYHQQLIFNYTQNYSCVEQPNDNLNFNHGQAQSDPSETGAPICQANFNPTINPPGNRGNPRSTTDPLYVLVPMFSSDNDQNPNDAIGCANVRPGALCGSALGSTLIQLFGAVPEGFKTKPLVYVQCPSPNDVAGTCTMHANQIDIAPLLAKLGYIPQPVTANIFVPLPNHSHVLINSTINQAPEWWQVIPVLVLNAADWPNQAGTSGINSESALQAAINAKQAVFVPSNFFLYFGSRVMSGMAMNAPRAANH
jgi:hypothetical protein